MSSDWMHIPRAWPERLGLATLVLMAVCLVALMAGARSVLNPAALGAGSCALARLLVERPRLLWWQRTFLLGLAAFLASACLSALLAPSIPKLGNTHLSGMYVYGLALALAAGFGLRDPANRRRMFALLLAAAGLWYLFELATLPWRSPYLSGRFVGFRGFHTTFGMELTILAAAYLAFSGVAKRARWVVASLLGAGLATCLLVMTQTRLGLLTLVLVTVPCAGLVHARLGSWRRRLLLVAAWILVVVPVAGGLWWRNASPERRSPDHVRTRVAAWDCCVELARTDPWYRLVIGHGCSRYVFTAVMQHYGIDIRRRVGENLAHAHNSLLQILIEMGVLGAAAFVAIWGSAFYAAVRGWLRGGPDEAALSGALVVVLMTATAVVLIGCSLRNQEAGHLSWFFVGLASACGSGGRRGEGGSSAAGGAEDSSPEGPTQPV